MQALLSTFALFLPAMKLICTTFEKLSIVSGRIFPQYLPLPMNGAEGDPPFLIWKN